MAHMMPSTCTARHAARPPRAQDCCTLVRLSSASWQKKQEIFEAIQRAAAAFGRRVTVAVAEDADLTQLRVRSNAWLDQSSNKAHDSLGLLGSSYILRLLKRYQSAIKPRAVRKFVRGMGYALFVLGLYVAHSAWVYFASAAPASEAAAATTATAAAAAAANPGQEQAGADAWAGAGGGAGAMDAAAMHDIAAAQRAELRSLSLNNHGVRTLVDVAKVEMGENIPDVSSSWGHEHHRDFQ